MIKHPSREGSAPLVFGATFVAALLIALPLASTAPASDDAHGSNPPNIIMILPDAWRAQAIGLVGSEDADPNLRDPDTGASLTPTLDGIAADGVRFRRCSAVYPLCGPNRAALMTAQYPHRIGVGKNGRMLHRSVAGIAEITRDAGYATALIGKWHMNTGLQHEEIGDGFVAPGGNRRHGFDLMLGTNSGHHHRGFHYFRNSPKPIYPGDPDAFEADFQTDQALSFISRNKDRPFHLVMSYGPPHVPHGPRYVPPEHWDRIDEERLVPRPNVPPFDDPSRWFHHPCDEVEEIEACWRHYMHGYYSSIAFLDTLVGRIVDRLKQEGLYDNTIIVFTSDHGETGGSSGRYSKGNPLIESTSIPLLISWPDGISPSDEERVRDELAASVDIPATLLGLLGLSFPTQVDGRDFAPMLTGTGPAPDSPEGGILLYGRLAKRGAKAWRAIRSDDDWLYVHLPNTDRPFGLWDLGSDPYQMENLAGTGLEKEAELDGALTRLREHHGEGTPHSEFPPHTTNDIDPENWSDSEEQTERFPLAFVPAIETNGRNVAQHRIYFGDEIPEDDDGWDHVFDLERRMGLQLPDGLIEYGKTYYWKVAALRESADPTETRVFTFSTMKNGGPGGDGTPGAVSEPRPVDGERNVPIGAALTWEGASGVSSYRVYFGTENPPPFVSEISRSIFAPPMDRHTNYYWRVDAVNETGITEGAVWTLRTKP